MVPECSSNKPLLSAADLHPQRRIRKVCCHQQHDLLFIFQLQQNSRARVTSNSWGRYHHPISDPHNGTSIVLLLLFRWRNWKQSQTPNRNTVWRLKALHKNKRSLKELVFHKKMATKPTRWERCRTNHKWGGCSSSLLQFIVSSLGILTGWIWRVPSSLRCSVITQWHLVHTRGIFPLQNTRCRKHMFSSYWQHP